MMAFLKLLFIVVIIIIGGLNDSTMICWAAEQGNEYLKYQEPQYSGPSMLSTFAYVLSLLFTFAIVLGLAYWVSRLWGSKMSNFSQQRHLRVVASLPLSAKSSICVVEILEQYYLFGVTDQQVTLLRQIDSDHELALIQSLSNKQSDLGFEKIFRQQINSLDHLSQKFPNVFSQYLGKNQSNNKEKR